MRDEIELGGEAKRSQEPRRRGLGKGLGAILSAPPPSVDERVLHDPLTFLPNRVLLDDKLNDAISACHVDDAPVGVFFVALDRFAHVNEMFGHQAGDDLLNDVAARLSASRRRTDTVARFGGDEFVVLCPYVGTEEDAARIAQQLLDEVARPTSVDGAEHQLTASVGVVVTDVGRLPERPDMLLGNAALAMRYVKDEGGGSWRFFEPVMREHAAARHKSRLGLRAAMESGDLVLLYEPVVELQTGAVVAEVALIRPAPAGDGAAVPEELGSTAPSVWDVLDEAEEAGLSAPVGRWLLDTALSDLATRVATGTLAPSFRLWIKVSLGQVTDSSFLDSLDELTAKHRVPPATLGLDIREAPGASLSPVASVLEALRERGVNCALDDFGAGPSNLDWLQQLPIAGLKLSPQVVASIDPAEPPDSDEDNRGSAMLRGLVSLGRALGLPVAAQGVTSAAQVASLRLLGCDLASGPFFEAGAPAESAVPGARTSDTPGPEALWAVPGKPDGPASGSSSPFLRR